MNKKKLIKKLKNLFNNNEFNSIPINLINDNGNKNYAYVTIIINKVDIAGSIVLSESLRKIGTLVDLVVIITEKINEEGKTILKKFYDSIIEINNVSEECLNLHVLNLVQYKKILLIKPNAIVLKYSNYLFNLKAPAGIPEEYLSDISTKMDNEDDYYKKINLFEKICEQKKTITNKKMFEGLMLLKPDTKLFERLTKNKNINNSNCFDKLGKEEWTLINPLFLGLGGFPHWTILFGLQFDKDKPYILENSFSIEERILNENYQLWYKFYRDITNKYPEFLTCEILSEPNQISKYFIPQLSKSSIRIKKILSRGQIDSIENLFDLHDVKNYYFYHLDISKDYDNGAINYSFEDDLIHNMINALVQKTNSEYWKNIKNIASPFLKKNTNISNKLNIEFLKNFNNEDKENLISYYTKINSNVCIIMNIQPSDKENNIWLDNNTISNVFYQKNIYLDGYTLKNILFNLLQNLTYQERTLFLHSSFSSVVQYSISLIFYKSIIDAELKSNSKNIYIFSSTNEKIRLLSIFFNFTTIKKFVNREIIFVPEISQMYMSINYNNIYLLNMLKYQTLKKWIYNNYSGDLIENLIVKSNFKFSDVIPIKKIVLYDLNNHLNENIKRIQKNTIELIKVKFIFYNNKNKSKYKNLIYQINDVKYYYQLDGIKFIV